MWYLAAIALLAFLLIIFLSVFWGRRAKTSPRVFVLHSLESNSLDISGVSLRRFEQLLELIAEAGLTVGSAAEALRDHTKVAITFDDGYSDLMQLAPLLRQQSMPITVFIPTAYVGKTNDWDHFLARGRRHHLDEEQIRELSQMGVQFESHGHSHQDLTSLSEREVRDELEQSSRILLDITGKIVSELAFPFGRTNQKVRDIAMKLGMAIQYSSSVRPVERNLVGRIPVTKLDNSFSLRGKLRGGQIAGIEALKSVIISQFSHLTPVVRSHSGVN